MRRVLYVIGGLIALPFVLLLLAWGAAQTGWGRALIAGQIEAAVNGPDMVLSIGRIEGSVPFDVTLRDVSVADGRGRFAFVDRARLAWAPLELLRGTLRVEALEADRVALDRLPESPATEETSGPLIPTLPFDLEVERLAIGRIVLGEPVAGVAAELSASGRARLGDPAEGLALTLDIQRLDGPTGTIAASLAYRPETGRFDIALTVAEPAGGVIAGLAGLPGRPPVDLTVKGGGTLDDFSADIDGRAGDLADVAGSVRIAYVDGARRATADLSADAAALLPDDLAPIVAGRTTLAASAGIADDGTITIERAALRTAAASIDAAGSWGDSADLRLALRAGPSDPFAALLPEGIGWRSADLTITVAGDTGAMPAVTLDGTIAGASIGEPEIEEAVGRDLGLSAAGAAALDFSAIAISRIAIASEFVTVGFEGSADPLAPSAAGRVTVKAPILSRFGALAGEDISGALDLAADATLTPDIAIHAGLDATIAAPRLAGTPIEILLGRTGRITGGFDYRADGSLGFDDLRIAGDLVSLGADGSAGEDGLDLNLRGRLAQIESLVPEMSGSVGVDAVVSGTFEAPAVLARIESEGVEGYGRSAESLAIDVDATGPIDRAAGKVWIDGVVDGTPATGYASLERTAEGALLVDDLSLDLPGLRAWGSGGIANGEAGASTVEFLASDLSTLAGLAGIEMQGRASGRISVEEGGRRASLAVRLDAIRVAGGTGVTAASLTADIEEPFGPTPRLAGGRMTARDLEAGGTMLAETQLDMSGDLAGLDVGLVVRSALGNVALDGTVARRGDGGFRVGLAHLQGDHAGLRVSLASASVIEVAPDGNTQLDGLALRVGGGSVTLTGTVGHDLNVVARLAGLPLSLADIASPGLGLSGTLDGTATVTGPAAAPRAQFELRAAGVTQAQALAFGVRRMDVAARGSYAGNTVTLASTTVDTPDGVRLALSGAVPLSGGGLGLAVSGGLDLSLANTLLAAGGDTVAGRVAVDLRVTGSLANPAGSGTVTLSGGRYENPLNGIALTDIAATLRGDARGLVVESLSAATAGGGTVSGRGSVGLDLAAGFPLDIALRAERATLIDSSLATVVADADLRLVGPWLRQPTLSGTVTLRQADVRIPESLPASIVAIEVRDKAVTPAPPPPGHRPARASDSGGAASGGGPVMANSTSLALSLDLSVDAPGRVYLRGRGIDAEMAGSLRVRGTLDDPNVDGELTLRRGSITQIGQRFDFQRGRIGFVGGSLDPSLDLVAQSRAGDITAQIQVGGFASAPTITLSSVPSLPQDEVLARLLFGRATGDLSPTQALQLAEAATELAGGGSATGGLIGGVRDSLGLDQLDLQAAQGGAAAVTLGRYLTDDIYVGVEQGLGQSGTRATVNFDITDNIKAQAGIGTTATGGATPGTGAAGAGGTGGSVGITMEWDY